MRIDKLTLDGWRNYRRQTLDFDGSCNVIYGENAQGKTNLLEAVVYLSCGKSPRAHGDRELIGFDRQEASVTAQLLSRERVFTTDIQLFRGRRRKMTVNGVPAKTSAALSDVLHTVFFCPEDLFLIRAGAAERRRFMDLSLCQLRPRYAEALAEYGRLYEHKTRILRDSEEKPQLLELLPDKDTFLRDMNALGLPGIEVTAEPSVKCGVTGTHVAAGAATQAPLIVDDRPELHHMDGVGGTLLHAQAAADAADIAHGPGPGFGGRVEALVPVGAQHRYAVLCPPQVDEPPGTLPGAGPAADALLLVHLGAAQIIDLHSAEPAGLHAGPAGHAAIGAEQAAVFIPLGPAAAAAMDRRRPGREFPLDCHGFSPSFLLISPISIPQITPLAKREPAIPAPTLPPTKKICAGGLTGEGKLHIISIRLENKLLLRR